MGRSLKKGPYVDPKLLKRIEDMNAANEKQDRPHLVALVHHLPRDGRPHDRHPRRPQACPSSSARAWWATSWASSRPPRTYRGHAGSDRTSTIRR